MELPLDYTKLDWRQRRAVREEYVRRQDVKCLHCGGRLTSEPLETRTLDLSRFPPGFLDHPIHLHHNHETGMTIGAVHALCNGVLFQYHGE